MNDDSDLAAALGEAPAPLDPSFRLAVIARVVERAQRRASLRRFGMVAGLSLLAGLAVPAARASGVTLADAQPIATVAGALALAYLIAAASIAGPRVLSRLRL